MPTKPQVVAQFQVDLQDLNARFLAQIDAIEAARLERFRAMPVARPFVERADAARATAVAERLADRARAGAARDRAMAAAAQRRSEALRKSGESWRDAEDKALEVRHDARAREDRRHQDKLEEIDRIRPLSQQATPRAAEEILHEKVDLRIQEDYETALDRAREAYQRRNDDILSEELSASEQANDDEYAALQSAEQEFEQSLDNIAASLHDALLKAAETKELEAAFQEQVRERRGRWEVEKGALRAAFKRDYENAT